MGYFSNLDIELREMMTVSPEEFYSNDFSELGEDHFDQPEMVATDDLLWGKAEYDLRSKEYYIEEDDVPF
mgnify:CR=1 FL=1